MPDIPLLYRDLAAWWPLLSPPEEYAGEARLFRDLMLEYASGSVDRVLELGSGGGNNASHLKRWFDMTLVDIAEGMLDVSRELNPECRHVIGDMRSVRLDEQFDAVFVHDAICYMASFDDLAACVETAFSHCRSGGAALFVPDHVAESFVPSTLCGGNDEGPRGLRYLEWTIDPDPSDHRYDVDYVYMLRDGSHLAVESDHHVEGLFSSEEWFDVIASAGFEPAASRALPEADGPGHVFVGVRP